MAEATGAIKVSKPAYKETPYESPARFGNGTGPDSPFYDKPTTVTPIAIRGIEEDPPATDRNSALIDATRKIFTAMTQQIAYHEREAARLREALKPFGTVSRQDAQPASVEDGIRAVLDIADKLQIGEQTS